MPLPYSLKNAAFQAARLCFRLTPMPGSLRDRLRQRFLERYTQFAPPNPYGKPVDASRLEHRPRLTAASRAIGYKSATSAALPATLPARLVAFYLPQFHPIPENNAWWGEGFTEWHNVTRALPQFEGHAQPRLPAELGYYDLRQADVMRRQMQLARDYGIAAFCTYFYWFAGKTLLETPLQQWLSDPSLDLPICLCWANENWSRRWDGRESDILIGQQHSAEDDLAFIAYISAYLKDPRYARVEGKPLLLLYRPGLLPDAAATAQRWREWCCGHGVGEIYLAYVQSFDRMDPASIGFDAAVSFPPNNTNFEPITAQQQLLNPDYRGNVYDWRELARDAMEQPDPAYCLFPGVNPGWDNEPRRSGASRAFLHASPRGYREWLQHAIRAARRRVPSAPLVFINAWNEWAEGAVLEPDTRLGHAWLDATREAMRMEAGIGVAKDPRPCVLIHAWYIDVLADLVNALRASGISWRYVITTAPEREAALRECVRKLQLDAEILVFENRGRDILPFLHAANRLLDQGVDVVLKLHTKRSTHRRDGEQWRNELLEKLLSPARAARILAAFQGDQRLGMVAADGHIQRLDYYWGANEANVRYLTTRLGIPEVSTGEDRFVAGSMFWVRLSALRPLLDAHLDVLEFESETAQIDGTLAHAVERCFGLAAQAAGFRIEDSASICGLPPASPHAPYAYAARSR